MATKTRTIHEITSVLTENLQKTLADLTELKIIYDGKVDRTSERIHKEARQGDPAGDIDFDVAELVFQTTKVRDIEMAINLVRQAMNRY